ncbi:MAG TPA: hypothetical protein VMQ48_03455, partial [Candidatus Saccharimonadales bacterium]|nr:hypothetical protein [Candidatus Saccharimonadales bacterium]
NFFANSFILPLPFKELFSTMLSEGFFETKKLPVLARNHKNCAKGRRVLKNFVVPPFFRYQKTPGKAPT